VSDERLHRLWPLHWPLPRWIGALLLAISAEVPADSVYAGLTKPFPPERLRELLDAVAHQ
jgi:hypothetical protein